MGNLVNSLLKSQLLQSLKDLSLQLPFLTWSQPLRGAKTVFIHGSGKTEKAVVAWKNSTGDWENSVIFQPGSTQLVELAAAVEALRLFQMNLST